VEETYATGTPIRVTSSDYINIIDNVIFDCAQTGIAVVGHSNDAPAFNVSIVGNTVAGYGRAYSSDPAFADPNKTPGTTCGILVAEGNVVTVNNNNVIEGSTTGNGAGIRVDGTSSNTKIMGNHISLTTYGIAMNKLNWFSNAFDISIENNTILNADSWPIYINPVSNPLGTGGLVPLRDLVIKDNTLRFSNGGTGCIRVENTAAANVLIKNNVSFSCGAVSIGGGATAITTSGNDLF
jgi:hypothetical protein